MATMISGLGGVAGYGEQSFASSTITGNLDDGFTTVSLTSVFGTTGVNINGTIYTQMFLGSNGLITFGSGVTTYTPAALTSLGQPVIAPFWTDIDISKGGAIYWDFDTANNRIIITWHNVAPYSGTGTTSFQVVLTNTGAGDFSVDFLYESIGYTNGGSGAAQAGVASGGTQVLLPGSGDPVALANYASTDFQTQDPLGGWSMGFEAGNRFLGDGVVDGTAGNDLIDINYTGDAEGDRIDRLDATGHSGTTGDADVVLAGAGNDTVQAGIGNDIVYGGSGNDRITTAQGDDWVDGGTENDSIDGGSGNDSLYGGTGDDTLVGGADSTATTYTPSYTEITSATQAVTGTNGRPNFTVRTISNETLTTGTNGALNNWRLGDGDSIETHTHTATSQLSGGQVLFNGISGIETLTIVIDGVTLNLNTAIANGMVTFNGASTYQINASGQIIRIGGGGTTTTVGTLTINVPYTSISLVSNGNATNAGLWYEYYVNTQPNNIAAAVGGNDLLSGGDGNDILSGGNGTDSLSGDAGNDTLNGEADNDSLLGGIGDDLAFGGLGDDTVLGEDGADSVSGGAGNDTVYGGAGNDTVVSDGGNDSLYGDAGDDQINDDAGNSSIYGGTGNDIIYAFAGDDLVFGGDGNDSVFGGLGNDAIYGDAGIDALQGDDGNDQLFGGGDNDALSGGLGVDTLYGGTGDDLLAGDAGADSLFGDDGTDTLNGGADADTLSGGLGNDALSGDAGTDSLIGGDGGDSLYGGTENDTLLGDAGNDLLSGGDGNDSLSGGADNDTLNGDAGDDTLAGGLGNDLLSGDTGADNLAGDDGNDTLNGGADADTLSGGLGNDLLSGDAGTDNLTGGDGEDSLYGGTENDTLSGDAGNDLLSGGDGNDTLSGGTGNDVLFGDAGTDTLSGGDGNDSLYGGTENDTLLGDAGNDLLAGGDGSDSLSGGTGNDTLVGDIGADTLNGGQGMDWADYSASTAGVTVDLNTGTASGGFATGDVLSGVDALLGSAYDDALYGFDGFSTDPSDPYTNVFYGNAGNDILDGRGGDDFLYGGADNDTVYGGSGADVVEGGTGNDQLFGGSGADTIDGGSGNDLIYGGAGADNITGGIGNDTIVIGAGSDGFGDVVAGSENSGDNDVLDLTAWGWALTNIIYDPMNPENGTVEFLDSAGNVIGTMTFTGIEQVIPCFTPGTLIATDRGEVLVEELRAGDRVVTRDNGVQEIRWISRRDLSLADLIVKPALRPVEIAAGALGHGLPLRDMKVSPQHRMLIEGARAEMLFGEAEVLVAATHLTALPGVETRLTQGVSYIHILCDRHEIICANGAWTESFQPAMRMVSGMEAAQRQEIAELFPELAAEEFDYPAARLSLKAHEAKVLLAA